MFGCFHTMPSWGSISPVSSLISVDFPAPLAYNKQIQSAMPEQHYGA